MCLPRFPSGSPWHPLPFLFQSQLFNNKNKTSGVHFYKWTIISTENCFFASLKNLQSARQSLIWSLLWSLLVPVVSHHCLPLVHVFVYSIFCDYLAWRLQMWKVSAKIISFHQKAWMPLVLRIIPLSPIQWLRNVTWYAFQLPLVPVKSLIT